MNAISVWQATVLGVLQGLSEFLPISSSAHLSLAPWAFGWPEPGLSFDVALHVGTLVAVAWYFRSEWLALARVGVGMLAHPHLPADAHERRLMLLVIGTIPGGIGGVLLDKYAESTFRAPALIATTLIMMGIVLWAVDRYAPADRPMTSFTVRDAVIIGVAQVAALVPGVSRSGATITAGRAVGARRESAAVFSFLLSLPITAAAALFKVPHAIHESASLAPLIAGVVAAAVSGWLAIALLLTLVKTRGYAIFAWYRVVLGIAVLALVFARR
jgi:undecaprenyl-diphosphatase